MGLNSGNGTALPTRLVGFKNFVRNNPKSDKFNVLGFHHIEFWCGDATTVSQRFSWGLGMPLVAKSDQSTGNSSFASFVLRSNDLTFSFSAPYSQKVARGVAPPLGAAVEQAVPIPYMKGDEAQAFFSKHGLAVRAVGVEVASTTDAFEVSVANGAVAVQPPTEVVDRLGGGRVVLAEVQLYGDVVLRFVESSGFKGPFLPNYVEASNQVTSYGLTRLDHAVGNVPNLLEAVRYIMQFSGFHEFAEFTAEDVGTVDSGLNSMVLANNSETVLLPINEPTFGTPRKSQIQTYLEHNEGPGLQHLALMCTDIVHTIQEMRARSELGGFDFMPRPSAKYYRDLPEKLGGALSEKLLKDCESLGILVDKDDQGILLQIFSRPVGDRPTVFLEVIQRVGCMEMSEDGVERQRGGCGGFGKGNFSELFKSIENYERLLDGPASTATASLPSS